MTTAPRVKKWSFSSTSATQSVATLCRIGTRIPTVLYTPEVKAIIDLIVAHCTKEVGWWGTVDTLDNGDFMISKIYVPEQFVTGAETDILPTAMAAMANEIITAGGDPGALYYWGHSHVNMGVTPSGQDETQVEAYLDDLPVFIRGIYNKRGDAKVDVYDRDRGLVFQCVPNGTPSPLTQQDIGAWQAHLDIVVKNPPAAPVTTLVVAGGTNGNTAKSEYTKRVRSVSGIYVPINTVLSFDEQNGTYIFPDNIVVNPKDISLAEESALDNILFSLNANFNYSGLDYGID